MSDLVRCGQLKLSSATLGEAGFASDSSMVKEGVDELFILFESGHRFDPEKLRPLR